MDPKRRKISSASIFGPRYVEGGAPPAPAPWPAGNADDKDTPHTDELAAYLALPQVANANDWVPLEWWEQHAKQ